MVVDSTPAFYVEHLKRLSKNKIQPYFVPGHVHQLEIIERLLRTRRLHGPAEHRAVRLRRRLDGPQPVRLDGDAAPRAARRGQRHLLEQHARQHRDPDLATILGQHVRVGNGTTSGTCTRSAGPTVKQVRWAVKQSEQFGRAVATPTRRVGS